MIGLNSVVWRSQTYQYFDSQMRKNFDDFCYTSELVCDTSLYEDIAYVCFKIRCLSTFHFLVRLNRTLSSPLHERFLDIFFGMFVIVLLTGC